MQRTEPFKTAGINIKMIATSEIRTTCIIEEKDSDKALKVVHKFFNLES